MIFADFQFDYFLFKMGDNRGMTYEEISICFYDGLVSNRLRQ